MSTITDLSQATLLHGSLDLMMRDGYWEGLARLAQATRRQRGFGDYFAYTFVCRGQAEVMLETISNLGRGAPEDPGRGSRWTF